ncbi:MAG: YceH family protein [Verrucomicrobiota bacterium]
MPIPELTPVEVRVLGALMEKRRATPEHYPLTLNALVNACNQKSSRDPVVDYDEKTVVRALDTLREKKLALLVSSAGGRVPKYEECMTSAYYLTEAQAAVLTVLMLRGPQTVGELRSRCARLHEFDSLEELQKTMDKLREKEGDTMVTLLPRQAGRKECRYAHLLCGEPEIPEEAAMPRAEAAREAVDAENRRISALEEQVQSLREQLEALRVEFDTFRDQF